MWAHWKADPAMECGVHEGALLGPEEGKAGQSQHKPLNCEVDPTGTHS